jgi:hypothetical protein
MRCNTVVTPECTTLEAVQTVGAFFVAVSTFDTCSVALFDGQHIQQTVDAKVGWQVLQVSTARDSTLSSTFWACYDVMAATRS